MFKIQNFVEINIRDVITLPLYRFVLTCYGTMADKFADHVGT